MNSFTLPKCNIDFCKNNDIFANYFANTEKIQYNYALKQDIVGAQTEKNKIFLKIFWLTF